MSKPKLSIEQIWNDSKESFISGFEAADFINDYFCTVSQKLDNNLRPSPKSGINDVILNDNTAVDVQTDTDIDITITDIIKFVKEIDISKASGFSEVNSKLLKTSLLCLSTTFRDLLVGCVRQRRFPEHWKSATVVVIPKKGNSKLVTNLRPISLIPLPGKLFEQFLNRFLINFMEENNLFTDKQMGFRRGRSTLEGCFSIVKDILDAANNGSFSMAVYIDLAKAFNTVNHLILLKKLAKYGLPTNFVEIMKSYLSNRKQRTIFNGNTSNENFIIDGVPQGSVLGPTLFLCYINDLADRDLKCKIGLYADDTVLYLSDSNVDIMISHLNASLLKLSHWCSDNRLTINASKTKAMIYGPSNMLNKVDTTVLSNTLMLDNTMLEFVESYVYLGVTLDRHLNFSAHINKLKGICSQKLFTLSKIRKYITEGIALKLYKSLILSILDYGDMLYIGASKKDLRSLQLIQNRALRIVNLAPRYTSNLTLHQKYNVLPLYIRRNNNLLKMVHTFILHNVNSEDVSWSMHNSQTNVRTTRQMSTPYLPLPMPRSTKFKESCAYIGPKLWLDLNFSIRSEPEKNRFKLLLKRKARNDLCNLTSVFE